MSPQSSSIQGGYTFKFSPDKTPTFAPCIQSSYEFQNSFVLVCNCPLDTIRIGCEGHAHRCPLFIIIFYPSNPPPFFISNNNHIIIRLFTFKPSLVRVFNLCLDMTLGLLCNPNLIINNPALASDTKTTIPTLSPLG